MESQYNNATGFWEDVMQYKCYCASQGFYVDDVSQDAYGELKRLCPCCEKMCSEKVDI